MRSVFNRKSLIISRPSTFLGHFAKVLAKRFHQSDGLRTAEGIVARVDAILGRLEHALNFTSLKHALFHESIEKRKKNGAAHDGERSF
jgi:hypothetical protein